MTLHVLFNSDGIPGWIGADPREGSEEVDTAFVEGDVIEFLASHRRTAQGDWVLREPPPPPTEAELAIQRESEVRAVTEAEAEAARWREEEIARRAAPDQLLRSMGKITIAELSARVAVIRTEVEAGR